MKRHTAKPSGLNGIGLSQASLAQAGSGSQGQHQPWFRMMTLGLALPLPGLRPAGASQAWTQYLRYRGFRSPEHGPLAMHTLLRLRRPVRTTLAASRSRAGMAKLCVGLAAAWWAMRVTVSERRVGEACRDLRLVLSRLGSMEGPVCRRTHGQGSWAWGLTKALQRQVMLVVGSCCC